LELHLPSHTDSYLLLVNDQKHKEFFVILGRKIRQQFVTVLEREVNG
jgi:hypothetical protein